MGKNTRLGKPGMAIDSPHSDCRTHYINSAGVHGQAPGRKWRRHRCIPTNREK
ncbi:hypothetical protein MTO96_045821, partial [Rhipicephalus appendiculatus]